MHYSTIASAIEFLTANAKKQPSLEEVAAHVHMSPYHFQRIFTEWAGVSPKKFLQFLTVNYAKQLLASNKQISLFNAADEAGLSGTGRLHDLFVKIESMTPAEFREGGRNLHINYAFSECAFGRYIAAATDRGICHVAFVDSDEKNAIDELQNNWPEATLHENPTVFHEVVSRFFTASLMRDEQISLHLQGTPFQLKVWEALLQIPEGQITTYGKLASAVGNPTASRAVGSAIGRNPVAYLIPCHRVIRNAGIIGDFRWGTPRKKAMIAWEATRHPSILVE
jgi:AraC family transcriptional regulator of adaptative response/methylated-DNA-[protein]-cysteine methyltransferase